MLIYSLYKDNAARQHLDVQISRGDSGSLQIDLKTETKIEDGTPVLISLKRYVGDDTPIWEKTREIINNKLIIDITPQDTDIETMSYVWDFRILYSDTMIVSPIVPSSFRILEVVGDVEGIE